jgi:hypothetical protein
VRFGLTEMLMVGLVIMLVIGASRFIPLKSRQPETKAVARPSRRLSAVEARDQEILRRRNSRNKILGIVLIIIGALLIITAPSLIKAFFLSYAGGAVIIIIGLASLFYMSRRS